MKRSLALGIAILSMVMISSAPAQQVNPPSVGLHDLKSVVGNGALRVAMTRFDLPAFHRRINDDLLVGPEVDLANSIAKALKVQVQFDLRHDSFDAVVDAVAEGRADIGISKLSQTYDRMQRVRFSNPYITLRHSMLFNRRTVAREAKGRPPEEALRYFSGRLGAITGSAYVEFAQRNFRQAQLVEMLNWNDAVASLVQGQVDALYRDEFEIRRILKLNPSFNVNLGAAVILDQKAHLSVAICDTCSKLQEFINYHLAESDGAFTLQRLLNSNILQ